MTPRRRRGAVLPALAISGLFLALAAGVFLLVFNFIARLQPDRGGRLSEALVVDGPMTVLPAFAETPNSRDVGGLLYRGLTRTGGDGKPVGELARSWEVDAAAKTFTFHLRPGLRWSDGAPLTSADAIYTLAVLQSDAGARSSAGQAWGGVTAAALDKSTIRYSLPQPSPAFLALTAIGLLPQHALQPRPVNSLRTITDAPTSGPFSVASAGREHLLLARNHHAFEQPFLDELDLRLYGSRGRALQALLDGEVDLMAGLNPVEARRVEGTVNRRVVTGRTFAYAELLLNERVRALADDHVRRAIGLALDRQGLIAGPLGGYAKPDYGPIPPAVTWAALPARAQPANRAAAARALEEAGWVGSGAKPRSRDGETLRLKVLAPSGAPYAEVAARISRELAAVGIAASVQSLPPEALLTRLQSHQYDLALTALDNGPDPDIYVFWHSSQAGPGGFNFSGMAANAALDKDLEDGRATADYALRRTSYVDAQKLIDAAHAAVFLYSPFSLAGLRDSVGGVTLPTGGQRYDRAQDWFVRSHRHF
ncbi:MAG: ABC transporter substrate-binding protein [Candidatus Dormibacteria bacterium]